VSDPEAKLWQTDTDACCHIRKVLPLDRALGEFDAWITGRKRFHGGDRMSLRVVEAADPHVKFNPLANWSASQVWDYIRAFDVPYNPLHGKGYVSIGCEPCTRPVLPYQHEREGRWWWETADKKECGLHAGNLADGVEQSS